MTPKKKKDNQFMRQAIYPGSFDPLTFGHVNIINRGLEIFDHVVVAVARNISKDTTFSPQERVDIIREVFKGVEGIDVDSFDGLLVDYMAKQGIRTILRGLRTFSDFEYEFQMALGNKKLNQNVETLFMITEGEFSYISSSIIKEIVALGGSARDMVPELVEDRLKKKLLPAGANQKKRRNLHGTSRGKNQTD